MALQCLNSLRRRSRAVSNTQTSEEKGIEQLLRDYQKDEEKILTVDLPQRNRQFFKSAKTRDIWFRFWGDFLFRESLGVFFWKISDLRTFVSVCFSDFLPKLYTLLMFLLMNHNLW